jgi:hypothetical protein
VFLKDVYAVPVRCIRTDRETGGRRAWDVDRVEDVFWVIGLVLDDGYDDIVGYNIIAVAVAAVFVVVEWWLVHVAYYEEWFVGVVVRIAGGVFLVQNRPASLLKRKGREKAGKTRNQACSGHHGDEWLFDASRPWATVTREVPAPIHIIIVSHNNQRTKRETCEIKVHPVLKHIKALDDIVMLDEAEQHNLRRDSPNLFMLHPRVVGYLALYDKLDGHLVSLRAMARGHDETVPAGAEFVPKFVRVDEVRV